MAVGKFCAHARQRKGMRVQAHATHFVLALAQKLLLAKLIDAQGLAHSRKQPPLVRPQDSRQLINLRLLQQLESPPFVCELVDAQVGLADSARRDVRLDGAANDEVRLGAVAGAVSGSATGKRHERNTEGCFVVVQLEPECRRHVLDVDNTQAAAPLPCLGADRAELGGRQVENTALRRLQFPPELAEALLLCPWR
jgi:hypothetical protein